MTSVRRCARGGRVSGRARCARLYLATDDGVGLVSTAFAACLEARRVPGPGPVGLNLAPPAELVELSLEGCSCRLLGDAFDRFFELCRRFLASERRIQVLVAQGDEKHLAGPVRLGLRELLVAGPEALATGTVTEVVPRTERSG